MWEVRSESGLGAIQEDSVAAAVSDGGRHIAVSPLPSTFAFRSFAFLIHF